MESLLRLLVILMLIAIIASLGSALYQLSSSKGDSRKMVRALALRVGLSLGLFVLLMAAWYAGLISPHGLNGH